MEFGIGIPTSGESWKVAQRAEELGFTHVWFFDTRMLVGVRGDGGGGRRRLPGLSRHQAANEGDARRRKLGNGHRDCSRP
jgi:hypothetical protein